MLSKNQIKSVRSLRLKKNRAASGLFIAEGIKIVEELLQSGIEIKELYATPDWLSDSGQKLSQNHVIVHEIKAVELERISALPTPNSVLAVCVIPSHTIKTDALKDQLVLLLDDIRDPGNLGTIIRIADWFGVKNIICSKDTVDVYNPKVIQSTMGSIARVRVHYMNLQELLSSEKDVAVYGALLEGENIYTTPLSKKGWLVIGNESKGISAEIQHFISHKITIPSFNEGQEAGVESLNAAIATAIICSEFRRR